METLMSFSENDCFAAGCSSKHTHTLTMLSEARDGFPAYEQETNYCLEHVLYFAAWLPYCYPGVYTLVGITPPAAELFSKG
jgi:hypothetical protein